MERVGIPQTPCVPNDTIHGNRRGCTAASAIGVSYGIIIMTLLSLSFFFFEALPLPISSFITSIFVSSPISFDKPRSKSSNSSISRFEPPSIFLFSFVFSRALGLYLASFFHERLGFEVVVCIMGSFVTLFPLTIE